MKHAKIEDSDVFQDVYCEACDLCLSAATYPLFCFLTVYQENPTGFVEHTYPELCKITDFEVDSEKSIEDFKRLFCSPNVCGEALVSDAYSQSLENCDNFESCYKVFIEQITNCETELDAEALELEDLDGESANTNNHGATYGHFSDENADEALPSKPKSFLDTEEFDYDDDNQFFYMTHGMSKSQYQRFHKKPTEQAKVSIFTNKNAAWTATLKRIFDKK